MPAAACSAASSWEASRSTDWPAAAADAQAAGSSVQHDSSVSSSSEATQVVVRLCMMTCSVGDQDRRLAVLCVVKASCCDKTKGGRAVHCKP